MATITTTIKEPKTFQQIQDQKRELDKEEALETLNNNIAKLIKTINNKSEKKISDDERQLKANQLALSKLQLRRAQLGLAKDEKSYSDYSVKYNSTHGIGSSIGVSQNTRDNATAIALSAVTAGALNPVIVKDVLLPPLKMMTRAVTGVSKALFYGLSSAGRRISGKTSSATEPDNEGKLHRKLDDILGAIKNKNKSSQKTEQKKEGFFSKALGALAGLAGTVGRVLINALKGALGAYLAIKLGEKIGPWLKEKLAGKFGDETINTLVNSMEEYLPSMAAGFAIAGWKGAVAGLAFHLLGEAIGVIQTEVNGPTLIDVGADKVNELLKPFGLKLTTKQFEGVVGGFALAGPKGAVLGFALGTEIVQKAIKRIQEHDYKGILRDVDESINNLKKGTPFENINNDAIKGAIAGGIIGGKFFGLKGLVLGALLGAAGGFVWNRYKNYKVAKENGWNTKFNWKTFDFEIGNSGKTYNDYYEYFLNQKDKNGKYLYSSEQAKQKAIDTINNEITTGKIDNSKTSFTSGLFEGITNWVKEHPLEIAGLVTLTAGISTLSGLISGEKLPSGLSEGLIAAVLAAAFALKIKKNQDKVNEGVDKHQRENPNAKLSESFGVEADNALAEGDYVRYAQAKSGQVLAKSTETFQEFENSYRKNEARGRAITAVQRVGYLTGGKFAPEEGHKFSEGLRITPFLTGFLSSYVTKEQLEKYNSMLSSDVNDWSNYSGKEIADAEGITNLLNRITLEDGKDVKETWFGGYTGRPKTYDDRYVIQEYHITNTKKDAQIEEYKQKQEEEYNQCLIKNTTQMNQATKALENLNKNLENSNNQCPRPQDDLGYTPYPLTQTNTAMTVNGDRIP